MSSKTFSYEDEEIQILGLPESKSISIYVNDSDDDEAQIDIPVADGAAMMQAIGECLPPIPETVRDGSYEAFMAVALEYLGKAIRALEAETAEAEAQAELEAEALKFLHVAQKHNNIPLTESWDGFMDGGTKLLYVNMARKAREINKENND